MRAVVCDRLGDPSVLKIEDVRIPGIGPSDVLIKVGAASVNFPDVLMLSAGYQHKPELPFIPGMEGAGTISAVGAEVKNWQAGDRVIFGVRPGAFAEYVRVPASGNLMRLPAGWSDAEGAAFRVGAHTAYHSLVHRAGAEDARSPAGAWRLGRRRPGGRPARQASRRAGDRHRQRRCAARRGARERRRPGGELPHRRFRGGGEGAMTDGHGADVIYDPVGGEVLEKSMRAAAYGARLLVVGFTSGGPTKIMSNHVLIKGLSILGVRAGETVRRLLARTRPRTMPTNCRGWRRSASCARTSRTASRWSARPTPSAS